MMTTEAPLSQQELDAIYDRNTYHGPLPSRSEPPKPVEPSRHPLAGNRPGVRSTSRKALKKVNIGPKQAQVLAALHMSDHALCDLEILDYLNSYSVDAGSWKINAVVARRNELVAMGKVEEKARYSCPMTPNKCIHWTVVEAWG